MDGDFARAVLGVPTHAASTEIQHAFRRAVRRAHPDVGGDAASMRLLVEARECLLSTAAAPAPEPVAPSPGPGDGPDSPAEPGFSPAPANPFVDRFTVRSTSHWSTLDRPRRASRGTTMTSARPVTDDFAEVLARAVAEAA